MRISQYLMVIFVGLIFSACGGGGGGSGGSSGNGNNPDITNFSGGSVADLEALSSNLTFKELNITGRLNLPPDSSTQISAEKITITASGEIGRDSGNCGSQIATGDLDLMVTGAVVLDGSIVLNGRTCSCFGTNAGNLSITADSIEATSVVLSTNGASGTSDVGLGCNGGNAGSLSLNANNITLKDMLVSTRGGSGGTGSMSTGNNGAPSILSFSAGNDLKIQGGRVDVADGTVNITAGMTDIFAEIDFNIINELINGLPDNTAPVVTVQSPVDGSNIDPFQPLDVIFQVNDQGIGTREGTLSGLGVNDLPYDSSDVDFDTGLITLTIDQPVPGSINSLSFSATDNKNNADAASVDNLLFTGPFPPTQIVESEINNDFSQAQFAFINATISGTITHGDNGALFSNIDPSVDIEDLFRIEGESVPRSFSVELTATGNPIASFDIDLYVIEDNGLVPPNFIASSVLPGTTETINNITINPGEVLYIGVSQASPFLLPESLGLRGYSLEIIGL